MLSARTFLGGLVAASVVLSLVACVPAHVPVSTPTPSSIGVPSPTTPTPTATIEPFNKKQLSIDHAGSIWVVSNKLRQLNPLDYLPPDLVAAKVHYVSNPQMRAEAAAHLEAMFAAVVAAGAGELQIQNAYRSYALQVSVHSRLVASLGEASADAQSARPGYSEHQTGLAVDVTTRPERCSIQACFGSTAQGQWLAANSYRFGFILRYPADKAAITGYIYEPWHFRYVGIALGTEMHAVGVTTLEEFFGLPAAPDYAH